MVMLSTKQIPIGICKLIKRAHPGTADIGFALLPEYHGYGYTQQIIKAVTKFSKKQLKLNHLLPLKCRKHS